MLNNTEHTDQRNLPLLARFSRNHAKKTAEAFISGWIFGPVPIIPDDLKTEIKNH